MIIGKQKSLKGRGPQLKRLKLIKKIWKNYFFRL